MNVNKRRKVEQSLSQFKLGLSLIQSGLSMMGSDEEVNIPRLQPMEEEIEEETNTRKKVLP
jgi:hypothetical protein